MSTRSDLRNLAIVAHVDHGKTTLVDALLRQSGAFGAHEELTDRVMDSTDLEKEKGITILAKNLSVVWNGVTLNIVDTPGHADFGGEVERALTMVDGVMLLVDASEGPLPQTRFVLRKALADDLPVIVVINKIDRPDARIEAVLDEVYELFMDLDAKDHQLDFPIVYCSGRDGSATLDLANPGTDLGPLCDVIIEHIPAPEYTEGHPLQAWVTNLDANPYVGRLALCRVFEGTIRKGQQVAWCRADGSIQRAKVAELFLTKNIERVAVDSAGPGELVAVAGFEDITIGETLADADDPRPLPVITVDEPALSMTIGINTSPLAGPRRHEAHRPTGEEPARIRAGRQRQHPDVADRPPRRVGGAGAWRAAAGRARRDDAPRGVRAHGRQARGRDARDRRHGLRAGRAGDDRRARRAPRRGHPAAGHPQGADAGHGEPRPRMGAARLPRSGARPDRVPHRVPDRDPRHRRAQPHLRRVRAVGGRDPGPLDGFARRRSIGSDDHLRDGQPAGPLDDDGRAGHRRVLRDDRRRELARRRHGREHLP